MAPDHPRSGCAPRGLLDRLGGRPRGQRALPSPGALVGPLRGWRPVPRDRAHGCGTLAVLFWFKLPDVSRVFLLVLFPVQFAVALTTRALMRVAFRRMRTPRHERSLRARSQGPGRAARASPRRSRAIASSGLKVVGFIDDDQTYAEGSRWPWSGTLADTEKVLNERVVDEVGICLPFSQWQFVDGIAHIAEEAGKIVRVPIDVLDQAFASGRVEDLDGTPVYSLVSGPDRVMALATKRAVDIVIAGLGLIAADPDLRRHRVGDQARGWRVRCSSARTRAGLHGRHVPDAQVPLDGPGRRGARRGAQASATRSAVTHSRSPTIRGSRASAGGCAATASTSCRSSGTS